MVQSSNQSLFAVAPVQYKPSPAAAKQIFESRNVVPKMQSKSDPNEFGSKEETDIFIGNIVKTIGAGAAGVIIAAQTLNYYEAQNGVPV